jgi:hypothetical protein
MFRTFGLTLFSITKASQHAYVELGSSHGNTTLKIGPHQLTFDHVYPTGSGHILGIAILSHIIIETLFL